MRDSRQLRLFLSKFQEFLYWIWILCGSNGRLVLNFKLLKTFHLLQHSRFQQLFYNKAECKPCDPVIAIAIPSNHSNLSQCHHVFTHPLTRLLTSVSTLIKQVTKYYTRKKQYFFFTTYLSIGELVKVWIVIIQPVSCGYAGAKCIEINLIPLWAGINIILAFTVTLSLYLSWSQFIVCSVLLTVQLNRLAVSTRKATVASNLR